MGEIRSSFQRRKKSTSVASSNSNSNSNTTPPGHSVEMSLTTTTTPQPSNSRELSLKSPNSADLLRRSPSTQSERSNTRSREPKTPPGGDAMTQEHTGTQRILFQDVPLTRSPPSNNIPLDLLRDGDLNSGPSNALWPESQLYTSTFVQPQSQYFNSSTSPRRTYGTTTATQSPSNTFKGQDSKTDPMQYLLVEEKGLNLKLQELLSMHADISLKGLSTQRVRRLIGQEFKSLSLVYDSMRELYEVQYKRRMDMLRAFETWESEKKALLEEVKVIRSLDNDEGKRLVQLKEDELSVNDEIKKVEQRLRQLKDKRGVLRGEINQVESIIESRSSSHLEQLDEIQRSEKLAIVKLSEEKSIISQVSQMNLNEPASMLGSFLMRFGAQSYLQPVTMLTPDQVMDVIKRQLETFQDRVDDYLNKGHVYDECLLIWEDTSEVLAVLEKDLTVTLKSQTSDSPNITKTKIEILLTKAMETLNERMNSFKGMNDVMKTLLMTEISTLQKGIEMMDPKRKAPEFKPAPLPARTAAARSTFITSSPAEPVLSASPPDVIPQQATKSKRSGSLVGNRLKDNLNNIRRTSNSGIKGGKDD